LREAFEITHNFRPFRPSEAVAVQRHAVNAKADAALFELGGSITSAHGLQIREQRTSFRKCRKNVFDFFAKPKLRRLLSTPARFHPHETNDPRLPVHVFGMQMRQIGL